MPLGRVGRATSWPGNERSDGPVATTAPVSVPADGRPRLRGWLHLAATPVALLAAWYLWQSATAGEARATVAIFGASLVGLYATSSLYHVGRWSIRVRHWLSRCDGAMIQLFIAGTFTPIAFHALDGGWRQWSLVAAWIVALVGSAIAVSPLRAPRWLATAGYLAVGWLTVVPFTRMLAALPWEGSGLIVLGGVLYTLGGVVYARRCPDPFPAWFGYHEVFHLLVIAASCAHYIAIWRYVLPIA